jgi:hypothetical protein
MRGSTSRSFTQGPPGGATAAARPHQYRRFGSQGWPAELQLTCYVYGPTGFVETVSDLSEFLARCPSCESVLLRMVRTFDDLWLNISGMSALRILMMINSTSESYSR